MTHKSRRKQNCLKIGAILLIKPIELSILYNRSSIIHIDYRYLAYDEQLSKSERKYIFCVRTDKFWTSWLFRKLLRKWRPTIRWRQCWTNSWELGEMVSLSEKQENISWNMCWLCSSIWRSSGACIERWRFCVYWHLVVSKYEIRNLNLVGAFMQVL